MADMFDTGIGENSPRFNVPSATPQLFREDASVGSQTFAVGMKALGDGIAAVASRKQPKPEETEGGQFLIREASNRVQAIENGRRNGLYNDIVAASMMRQSREELINLNPAWIGVIDTYFSNSNSYGFVREAESAANREWKEREDLVNGGYLVDVNSSPDAVSQATILRAKELQANKQLELDAKRVSILKDNASAQASIASAQNTRIQSQRAIYDFNKKVAEDRVNQSMVDVMRVGAEKMNNRVDQVISQFRAGKLKAGDAVFQIGQLKSQATGALFQVRGALGDQSTYNSMLGIMNPIYDNAIALIEGKSDAEYLENKIKVSQSLTQLAAYKESPKLGALVAISDAVGNNNPQIGISISSAIASISSDPKSIMNLGNLSVGEAANLEPYQFDVTKNVVDKVLSTTPSSDGAANMATGYVSSLNQLAGKAASPRDLKPVIDGLTTDGFAAFIKSGGFEKLNPEDISSLQQGAIRNWNASILPLIDEEFSRQVTSVRSNPNVEAGTLSYDERKVRTDSLLKLSSRNGLIIFEPKEGLKKEEQLAAQNVARRVNSNVSQALSQLVKLNAHVDGSVNYNEYADRTRVALEDYLKMTTPTE